MNHSIIIKSNKIINNFGTEIGTLISVSLNCSWEIPQNVYLGC